MKAGARKNFPSRLSAALADSLSAPLALIPDSETPITDKYDDFIPAELLRRAYAIDHLCPEEVESYFLADIKKSEDANNGSV